MIAYEYINKTYKHFFSKTQLFLSCVLLKFILIILIVGIWTVWIWVVVQLYKEKKLQYLK